MARVHGKARGGNAERAGCLAHWGMWVAEKPAGQTRSGVYSAVAQPCCDTISALSTLSPAATPSEVAMDANPGAQ